MSEEISSTPQSTATGNETATQNGDTTTQSSEYVDLQALHKSALERNSGQDRITKAMDTAKMAQQQFPDKLSIDNLDSVEGLNEGGHKGIDYNSVINSLPDDAKNLLSNLRADYTRKTQELAQQRKTLEEQYATLTASDFDRNIQDLASRETVELDPYDADSFNQRIEQEVARRLNEMMEPIRQQQLVVQKKAELQQFKEAHPDMMDYKQEIVSLLRDKQDLSLQDAYFMAKGQKTTQRLSELEAEVLDRRSRMAEVGLKLGTPSRGGPNKPPKGLKGYEVYQWLKQNRK